MDNQILIDQAIKHLEKIKSDETDTIEIQSAKYDDGSTMLTINVAFLIPEDETTEGK